MQPVMPRTTPGRALCSAQHARAREHPLFGPFAHGAGVEQDQVGARRVQGPRVAGAVQHPQHQLGVGDVHLAAIGLDVDLALGRARARGGAGLFATGNATDAGSGRAGPAQGDEVTHRPGL